MFFDLLFYYEDELCFGYQFCLVDGSWLNNWYFLVGLIFDYFVVGDVDGDGDIDFFVFDIIVNIIFSFCQEVGVFWFVYIEWVNLLLFVYISGGDFDDDGDFDLLVSEFCLLFDG